MSDLTTAGPFESMTQEARDLAIWTPRPSAPEVDYAHQRDTVRARAREMAVFNPYGANASRVHRTSVVGTTFKLALRPDAKYLGIEAQELSIWARAIEAEWEAYANSPTFDCDAEGRVNFTWLMSQFYSTFLHAGEGLAVLDWDEKSFGYKTCMRVLEPERLSQPMQQPERRNFRQGIEMNDRGRPVAYHIRRQNPFDRIADGMLDAMKWDRVPRYSTWGRPNIIHMMDPIRPGMIRGLSPFVAALRSMNMLNMYNAAELEAAIVQAGFAAVVKTELPNKDAMGVIGAVGTDEMASAGARNGGESMGYMNAIAPYHRELGLTMNGAKVVHLLPGETLETVKPNHPGLAQADFNRVIANQIASAVGVSYEQLTRDFSKVNFASAKMSLGEIWRHFMCCRDLLVRACALPFFFAWLEEALERGTVTLPNGKRGNADDLPHMWRALAGRSSFISWGMPQVNPVQERKAQQVGLDCRLTSLTEEVTAEGHDIEDVLGAIARERQIMEELGIPLPEEVANAGKENPFAEEEGSLGDAVGEGGTQK